MKSELYLGFLPMLNSHSVALIEHPRLEHQLVSLERKVTRNGRDTIDHMRGAHDDIANAVAGACVLAQQLGAGLPAHRLQLSHLTPMTRLRRRRRTHWRRHAWKPVLAVTSADLVGRRLGTAAMTNCNKPSRSPNEDQHHATRFRRNCH